MQGRFQRFFRERTFTCFSPPIDPFITAKESIFNTGTDIGLLRMI
jgi:hypothetical protein